MNTNYNWPSDIPKSVDNVFNTGITILKEKYGALSQDTDSLYSRICVGNSLLSLEPFRGCPLSCAYCMANNDLRSLKCEAYEEEQPNSIKQLIVRKPERLFSSIDLVDALVKHPAFIPHKSIIGFGTGSTEFFLPGVGDEMWQGVSHLRELGYNNPIWIICKSFLDTGREDVWAERLSQAACNSKVILSISDVAASSEVEPYQVDRFAAFSFVSDLAKYNSNIVVSHHLRPFVPETENGADEVRTLVRRSSKYVSSICVGGLRIDPGMMIFWQKAGDLKKELKPGDQEKILDIDLASIAIDELNKMHLDIPVFTRSSEMLSHYLHKADFNLYRYRTRKDCFLFVPPDVIKQVEYNCGKSICKVMRELSISIGLQDLSFSVDNGKIYISQPLKYQEERALIHAIGHSEILP